MAMLEASWLRLAPALYSGNPLSVALLALFAAVLSAPLWLGKSSLQWQLTRCGFCMWRWWRHEKLAIARKMPSGASGVDPCNGTLSSCTDTSATGGAPKDVAADECG